MDSDKAVLIVKRLRTYLDWVWLFYVLARTWGRDIGDLYSDLNWRFRWTEEKTIGVVLFFWTYIIM